MKDYTGGKRVKGGFGAYRISTKNLMCWLKYTLDQFKL